MSSIGIIELMLIKHTVVSVDKLTPSILNLVLKRNDGQPFYTFQPGQYATLSFYANGRPSVERCFSIASSPTTQDRLEFGVRIGGKYTQAINKLKAGDSVNVRGPFGGFVFDAPQQQNVVFCAGGIGITPFMSMLRFASTTNLKNNITLLYSVRNQDEVAYYKEINQIATLHPNIRVFFVVGEGPIDKIHLSNYIFQGRINPEMLAKACDENYKNTTFFLCGPPPFMGAVVSMIKKSGADASHIITEAFNQGKQKGTGRGWPFNMYTIGAVGTFVSVGLVMTADLLKTIPESVLPEQLSSTKKASASSRQTEIDNLINSLELSLSPASASPNVISAEKEAADAQALIDATNGQSQTSTGSNAPATPTTPKSTPAPVAPAPTPVAKPKPVCTTVSGVTTCL